MIDLQRIEQLAHTMFDFVCKQAKSLKSPVSVAAKAIAKHFLGLTRQDTQSIRNVLENSVPRHSTKTPLARPSTVNLQTLKQRLVDQSEALLDNQGLVIDDDHFQLLKDTWQAKAAQNNVGDIAIHGIGTEPERGFYYMSMTIKEPQTMQHKDVMVPVKVLKPASNQDEVASALIELAQDGKQNRPAQLCGEANASHINALMASMPQMVPELTHVRRRELVSEGQHNAALPKDVRSFDRPVSSSDCPETSGQHSTPQKPKRVETAGSAFVDKQLGDNLCGVAAINGFFQQPLITAKEAAKAMIDADLSTYGENQTNNLSGLLHPKVVAAMKEGKKAEIRKDEFLKESNSNLHDVHEQWRSILNYLMPGDENKTNRDRCKQITLTPEVWIASQGGMRIDHVVNIINRLQGVETYNKDGALNPSAVEMKTINPADYNLLAEELNKLTPSDESPDQFPHVVCRIHGHYFALVKDAEGTWLRLDSLKEDSKPGLHRISGWLKTTSLAEVLSKWEVEQVIANSALIRALP